MRYVNRNNPYKARWNEKFERYVDGAKRKALKVARTLSPEAIDTETYEWEFDEEDDE